MEIIVKCPNCKSRYSFHEEPVNGRLRFPVSCTNCGADGTAEANEFIRKSFSGELEQERQRNSVWWRRIFRKSEDEEPEAGPTPEGSKPDRTLLGIVGACVGGFGGMMLWYGITTWSGWEIGYVAWAVGILAGFGARLFVSRGSFTMASVAALCAFLAIMAGQVLVMQTMFKEFTEEVFKGSYSRAVSYAKDAVKVVTDDDIRALLKKHPTALLTFLEEAGEERSRDGKLRRLGFTFMSREEEIEELAGEIADDATSEPFGEEDIARYRREELPLLKELADGTPTQSEFDRLVMSGFTEETSLQEVVMQSWSPYQLLWLVLGIGSAYKLAYNKSETEDV